MERNKDAVCQLLYCKEHQEGQIKFHSQNSEDLICIPNHSTKLDQPFVSDLVFRLFVPIGNHFEAKENDILCNT